MSTLISVENVSKLYRLGEIGTGSLAHDVNRWWHRARGKEDPYLKIGQSNDRSTKGDSDYVYALKDISFVVEQGEVLGIIGRNGAGKSTLLKILSRVTTPTTGEIKVRGRIASLLEVGTGFHPELSGRDNIYLNGAILGMRKTEIESKFDDIVEFSGCERYIDTPVKRYSSGMYVRLAFAVAAHLESEILIVDEVLAVGDAEFQKKCLGKMKDVAGQGRTVLFVSHNMSAMSKLCDDIAMIENGMLVFRGPTNLGIERYLQQGRESESSSIRIKNKSTLPICITKVSIENIDGAIIGAVDNSKKTYIRISYRRKNYFVGDITPSVYLTNETGDRIFQHHSRLSGKVFKDIPLSGDLIFQMPKIPVPAGNYVIGVALVSDRTVIDNDESILSVTITDASFYESGETTPASHGLALVEGNWSMEPSTAE
jgi:lipopolysaccharide transport system ATP-binding protein